MATATIERPGVQVSQEFRTATPTILIPQLQACVLGPCFQVVEAIQDTGALNADAKLALPARIVFLWDTGAHYTTAIENLVLSVNNAAPVSVAFVVGPMTATAVAAVINAALIAGLVAEVEDIGNDDRVVLRTMATGENASLEIGVGTGTVLLTNFGLTIGKRDAGRAGYVNALTLEPQFADYPDPRSNLTDLTVDYDTVRMFIDNGAGGVAEVSRLETFLDGAFSAVAVADDGDGDNLSPYLNFTGGDLQAHNAALTGTVVWSTLPYPATFGILTLIVSVDGTSPITITFSSPVDAAAAIASLNAQLAGSGTAVLNGAGHPVLTSNTGYGGSIQILPGGTINEATIGLAEWSYAASKPNTARAEGNTDIGSALTFSAANVWGRVLRMSLDGQYWQSLTVPASVTDAAALVVAINGLWGAGAATLTTYETTKRHLVLHSTLSVGGLPIRGRESTIRIDAASDIALLLALGLTTAGAPFESTSLVEGAAYPVAVGDEVWVDSVLMGTVVEIPTTPTNQLRMSVERLLTFTGASWTIKAKTLDNDMWTASRPSTDLVVSATTGTVRIKARLYRDSGGVPTVAGPLNTYLAYTALRRDVTSAASNFNLLRIGSVTDLQNQLAPIDTQNPLGLAMYMAILNAPGMEVTGCGVSATSTTEPDGTLTAYTEGFQFLESKDVYAISPLTHALDVGVIAQIHVDEMSLPANGLERLVILNPNRPTRQSSTLIASGPLGNVNGTIAVPSSVVSTGIANLQSLLAAAGYPGPNYTISDAVYLEFESDSNKYLVLSVSGGYITLSPGPFVTGNTDAFYFDNAGVAIFDTAIVDRPFTLQVRGANLANRTEEATAYADIARTFLDRRVICTMPDQAKATIDGLETLIEGYYLNAGLAGKISAKLPQAPLTEDTLVGFTGTVGSQDRYSESQLQILSGGGLWVFYQPMASSLVRNRHQLTTDMSSVEKRELSVMTALDFASKMIRTSLRNFIGRYNITTTVSDALTIVMEGIRNYLVRMGVFKSFSVSAARQSTSQPDMLEIDVVVGALYPLNYIRVTLQV